MPVLITFKAAPGTPELKGTIRRGKAETTLVSMGVPREGESVVLGGQTYIVDSVQWDFDKNEWVGLTRVPMVTVTLWLP